MVSRGASIQRHTHSAVLLIPLCAAVATLALTGWRSAGGVSLTPQYLHTLGGPGHATMYPSGIEIVPNNVPNAGNVVIADTGNNQVEEYTSSGALVWQVGSEGRAAPCTGANQGFPQFEQPRDVGVDSAGNVYVADNGNGRVLKLSGTTGRCIAAPFKLSGGGAPIGVTVGGSSSAQLVYVANGSKSEVDVFTTAGVAQQKIVSSGVCKLNRMRDAAVDAAGNVYVANYESNNILEFDSQGNCLNWWGTKGNGPGQFLNPYGVTVGTDPQLPGGPGEAIYVADSNNDRIQEFLPDPANHTTGSWVATIGAAGPYTSPGTFTQLRRVAVDAQGNIWGADLWGYRVEQFLRTSSGYSYSQTIPSPVVPAGNTDTSVFNQVRGLAFDGAGDILAMDTVNQRVVVMNLAPDGQGQGPGHIQYMCGQRGFTSVGDFNWPRGVAFDPAANQMWIADTKQSDLQVLTTKTNGTPCQGAHQGGTVGGGLANLNYPYSIAIGGGYAWIADTKNNRVVSWNVSAFTPSCSYDGTSAGTHFAAPAGISVDPLSGNVFVADSGNHRVVELGVTNGCNVSLLKSIPVPGQRLASSPYGVAADGAGHLAVADRANNVVVVLNEADGSAAATITGSDVTGGGPTSLQFPENVAYSPAGHLYIADTYNDRVLEYSLS